MFFPVHPFDPVATALDPLADIAQQLSLENKLALLVLLGALIRLVVFPAYRLLALLTIDITHDVSPRRHGPLRGFALFYVYHAVE